MRFLYHAQAGSAQLELEGEDFSHIIKARRARQNERIELRNLKDSYAYTYAISAINKRSAKLSLESRHLTPSVPRSGLHLLWAIIDPKVIEKTLPMLNELGVSKISFFYAARSQRHFKLNLERMEKILIASSQQCGRGDVVELELVEGVEKYQPITAFDLPLESLDSQAGHCALWLKSAMCKCGFVATPLHGKARSVDEPLVLYSCSPCQSPDLSSQNKPCAVSLEILECQTGFSPKDSEEVSESTFSKSHTASESTLSDSHSVIASAALQSTETDSKTMDCHDFASTKSRNDKQTESAPHATAESAQDSKVRAERCCGFPLTIAIGCEGGFSEAERAQFAEVISLGGGAVLRSESAAVFLASLAATHTHHLTHKE